MGRVKNVEIQNFLAGGGGGGLLGRGESRRGEARGENWGGGVGGKTNDCFLSNCVFSLNGFNAPPTRVFLFMIF